MVVLEGRDVNLVPIVTELAWVAEQGDQVFQLLR
jgi:hypothetical protein